jgi:hypothetical protein
VTQKSALQYFRVGLFALHGSLLLSSERVLRTSRKKTSNFPVLLLKIDAGNFSRCDHITLYFSFCWFFFQPAEQINANRNRIRCDFNGDGTSDLAALGHNKSHTVLLGIVSDSNGYRILKIEQFPLTLPQSAWIDNEKNTGLSTFMEYCSKERAAISNWKSHAVQHDAFLYGTCGKGFTIYWMENGVFRKSVFSD